MREYIRLARVDHWIKNVFVLPGIAFAFFAEPARMTLAGMGWIILALLATCVAASSNYVLNEVLDAARDRFHPQKSSRPLPSGRASARIATAEWLILAFVALGLAFFVNAYVGWAVASLLAMGLIYNVPPIRTKDLPYLDAVSEAVNNPIRLVIGWYATGVILIPPLSLLLAYWALGAFFMTVKRLAEFRHINDRECAANYRASFKYYDEPRLLSAILHHTVLCAVCAGVFMVRYHLELLLAAPAFALFLTCYLRCGLQPNSPAQHPEKLIYSPSIVFASLFLAASVVGSLSIQSPTLRKMFTPSIPVQQLSAPVSSVSK